LVRFVRFGFSSDFGAEGLQRPGIAGHPRSQPNPRYRCFLPDLTEFTRFVIERDPAIAAPDLSRSTLLGRPERVNQNQACRPTGSSGGSSSRYGHSGGRTRLWLRIPDLQSNRGKHREAGFTRGTRCVAEARSGVLTCEFPWLGNREIGSPPLAHRDFGREVNRPGFSGDSGLPRVERRQITGLCCHNRDGGRYGKEGVPVGVLESRIGFG